MTFSEIFTDVLYLGLMAMPDLVNILAGLLVFLAILSAIVSALQPLRR
jgi:hypothetical protein